MKRIDLAGRWSLEQKEQRIRLGAPVPGDVHSALLQKKLIPDPYYGKNENDIQWVGESDWAYSRNFSMPAGMLNESSVYLNCDCIDTFADIYINGKKVGSTANMFRRYRFEVKKYIRPGTNRIRVAIRSAEKTAHAMAAKLPYKIPYGDGYKKTDINLIRKVPCHGGWDWGIILMASGIYGDLYIGATSLCRIEHVYTQQEHTPARCRVTVCAEVFSPAGGRTGFKARLGTETFTKTVSLKPGMNKVKGMLTVKKPKLWWPNGYGEQYLYPLAVRVGDDEVKKQIGLRSLRIVNEPDRVGKCMKVRVNGKDIFAKGADWIPCDALPGRQTSGRYNDLLESAQYAGMNMLRVWGGGQYERDIFYDLCDEKGLLIWQDFMFACALYPSTPAFLENVRAEAEYQVKRLRDHACLALWCGDNENIGALNWFPESKKNRDRYIVDYDRLNHGVLARAAADCDPTRIFWPSSPCAGPGDFSDNWHNDKAGDMHYWEVWHGGKSFEAYYGVVPRFCSEFGFQSFPSVGTVRSYAAKNQQNITAPVMEFHQRNSSGNSKILEMFSRYFRIPAGFENSVYLSQVQQLLAIKTGVEHWRRCKPVCMGTIYWQLNDNWPVASWASLNYDGSWKLLHYGAKRFYAPVLVSAVKKNNRVEVWVTSDVLKKLSGSVEMNIINMNGRIKVRKNIRIKMPANGSRRVAAYPLDVLAKEPEQVFMTLSLRAGPYRSNNELFFTPYKNCELPAARIRRHVSKRGKKFEVKLSSSAPAFFVSVFAQGIRGEFDDNCVTLLKGAQRKLIFTPKEDVSFGAFKKALKVMHLRETY